MVFIIDFFIENVFINKKNKYIMSKNKYGCIKSILDGSESVFKADSSINLPSEYSYKKYIPSVLNQGNKPICVPCSLSSFINWDLNIKNNEDEKDYKIDLMQIYDSRSNSDDGMMIKEALSYLKNNGVNTSEGNYKINDFAIIGSIEALKRAIVMNGICIGGVPTYETSYHDFWNETNGGEFLGGHAIAIIGYDKDGFIIRNSWGKDYGYEGYSHMKYDDFNVFYELWTILK